MVRSYASDLVSALPPGIQLLIPGFKENDMTVKQIAYLILNNTLGEYDVETQVGLSQILAPESPRTAQGYPFSELPSLFDHLVSMLTEPHPPN